MLKYELSSRFRGLCAEQTPLTNNLFGDDLTRVMKNTEIADQIADQIAYKSQPDS